MGNQKPQIRKTDNGKARRKRTKEQTTNLKNTIQ